MVAQISTFLKRYWLLLLFMLCVQLAKQRVAPSLRVVIYSDAEGYFAYLPAVFNLGNIHAVPEGSMNLRKNEQGENVMKYTCGVAYFQLPFFLVARAISDVQGVPRTEIYHSNYSWSVALAGISVCFLGLFFLKKALLERGFSRWITFLTILGVLGGTNLWHYATKESGMSHAYTFSLFAFLAWWSPRFLAKPSWKNALILGFVLGWILLIRPTNLIVVLFLLLYDVYDFRQLHERLRFFWGQRVKVLVTILAAMLPVLPQLWYWSAMTGHWVRYSYEGETFAYWKAPKILEVLFDTQNGLFMYSPMVLLMVGMLFWQPKSNHAPALLLIFSIATYLFASWWAWWFGGAFGHRSYVEYYALLAFPLAGWLQAVWRQGIFLKMVGMLVFLFFTFYSVKMSYLYNHLPTPWDGPDWRWSWEKIIWVWSHLFS